MHKSIHSKNFRWCAAIETFPKTAKNVSHVYKTGIHFTKSDFDTEGNIFITIGTFRIILTFPISKEKSQCAG